MNQIEELRTKLKSGQVFILDVLDQTHQVMHSYNDVKPKIRQLQEGILSHFALQKDSLFDQLHVLFADDHQKVKIIEFLKQDLRDIKVRSLLFFDQHPADMGDLKPGNFIRDFMDYSQNLSAHIHSEREYLLPLLKELSI